MPIKSLLKHHPLKLWQAMFILQMAIVIPGLFVQGFIYYQWYQAARKRQQMDRLQEARSVSRTLQTYVLGVRHQAELVGAVLRDMKPGPAANALLDTVDRQSDSVGFVHWVNPEGIILASSISAAVGMDVAQQPYYQAVQAGKQWVVSNLFIEPATQAPAFVVACAIRENGRTQGAIVAEVEALELRNILDVHGPRHGETLVYDAQGSLLFLFPGAAKVPQTFRRSQDPLLAAALQGQEVVGEVVSLVDDSRQLAARVPIPELGWVAGANRPAIEAVTPMVRSFAWVLGLMTLVILGSSMIALLLSRRIVGDVRRLQEHAQALGKGELDRPVRVEGISELKELALAYQEMATRRKEAEDAQLRTAENLARSNQELQQFAHLAAHDLQEPLRMVKGFMSLLQRQYQDKLDVKAVEFIHVAVEGTARMSRLISSLLSYAHVDYQGQPFEDVDCNEVLRRVLENLRVAIHETGAVVEFDPLPTLQGHPSQLEQLFQNLLSNAIKFHDRRPPVVHVSARRLDEAWEFSVRDNGIGIAPDLKGRLFMMFQRLHDREKYPGTGIGLATCKKIVERHGGKIWGQSQPGEGSTFWFTIKG